MAGLFRITTLLALAVLGSACIASVPSSFFRHFSLRQVIDNHRNQLHVDCESPNGGGGIDAGGGGSVGVWGRRKNTYSFTNSTGVTCKLDPNGFDEAVAIPLLQQVIEQSISSSGAKVTKSESSERASFTLTYTVNGAEGKLTVSGQEFFGQYSFQSTIAESRK